MLSILLFVSGGEIFIILLVILIFFGADKIPEFTRMMGKGVREFRKARDDIKRELQDGSSGVVSDIRSISEDLNDSLTKEIAEPMQDSIDDTAKTFENYQDQYNSDFYYDNQSSYGSYGSYGNEYHNEARGASETKEFYEELQNPKVEGFIERNDKETDEILNEEIEPETSNFNPETSNLKPQTSNLKPQTSNLKPET